MKLRLTELNGELNDTRDQMAALDVEVSKLNNKCQVRSFVNGRDSYLYIYLFFTGDLGYTV